MKYTMCCKRDHHCPDNMAAASDSCDSRAGSNIFCYYTILNEEGKGKLRAKCNNCQTIITGSRAITSNFVTHLKVR